LACSLSSKGELVEAGPRTPTILDLHVQS
jgi:hypothetical protein